MSALDRAALLRELMLNAPNPGATAADFEEHADRILALLRPVDDGATLTRTEAYLAAAALRFRLERGGDPQTQEARRSLAGRLEKA